MQVLRTALYLDADAGEARFSPANSSRLPLLCIAPAPLEGSPSAAPLSLQCRPRARALYVSAKMYLMTYVDEKTGEIIYTLSVRLPALLARVQHPERRRRRSAVTLDMHTLMFRRMNKQFPYFPRCRKPPRTASRRSPPTRPASRPMTSSPRRVSPLLYTKVGAAPGILNSPTRASCITNERGVTRLIVMRRLSMRQCFAHASYDLQERITTKKRFGLLPTQQKPLEL